jgi:putative ABC transport system permease protein
MWNRRRTSLLVILEIAAAFVAASAVCALSLHAWSNYQRPLGFTYENIWRVSVGNEALPEPFFEQSAAYAKAIEDIRSALLRVPGVLGADTIGFTPFLYPDGSVGTLGREGATVLTWKNTLSAAGVADLGIHVVAGRSFGREDEGQDYLAALVNRDFVDLAFGGASPLGKRINFPTHLERLTPELARQANREIRAVGVIDDFRQYGEFMDRTPYVILLGDAAESNTADFLVKVAPGTPRRLEESIRAAVMSAAAGFQATVTPWEELRTSRQLEVLLPLRIGATLAVFLLAMVALGLVGVVWQDVVRRTHEMGVRRAGGASAAAVRTQILLEVLAISGAGIVIGSLAAIQVPLLSIVPQIDWPAALPALGLSAMLILALAAGAAVYPALVASGRQPADALRYE